MINGFACRVIEKIDHGPDGFLQGCAGGYFPLEFEGAAVGEVVDGKAEIWSGEFGLCILDRLIGLVSACAVWDGYWCGFTVWEGIWETC